MGSLLSQIKWQFVILARNQLLAISIAVTLIYGVIFFFIRELPNVDKFLTLLIYNDPAMIGLFFVGLSVIIEKSQGVLMAYLVSPTSLHVYLISRIISLSMLGTGCAFGMTLAVLGWSFYLPYFILGVFGTCLLFSILGAFVVAFTTEFLLFMLKSIPVLLFMSLPLLNYFELTDWGILALWPIDGSLQMIAHSYTGEGTQQVWLAGCLSLLIWVPVLYAVVYHFFRKQMATL